MQTPARKEAESKAFTRSFFNNSSFSGSVARTRLESQYRIGKLLLCFSEHALQDSSFVLSHSWHVLQPTPFFFASQSPVSIGQRRISVFVLIHALLSVAPKGLFVVCVGGTFVHFFPSLTVLGLHILQQSVTQLSPLHLHF